MNEYLNATELMAKELGNEVSDITKMLLSMLDHVN